MTIKDLKQKLKELPPECENCEVCFGEAPYGELLKKIKKIGHKIFLSFI